MNITVPFNTSTRDGRKLIVRNYKTQDRERIRWICSETGFIGKPQESVFIGREPFADLWSKYWTDYEPQSAFVAEVGGQVEGYILGCLDTNLQEKIWARKCLPLAAIKMASPAWWSHKINRKYIAAIRTSKKNGELDFPMDDIKKRFPAHLHTNIGDPSFRGQGLGGAMMRVYLDYLKKNNIPGVHLGTTSHNRQALPFYEHVGFETIFKKRATFFDHAIEDPPLYIIYMGLQL